jgi:MFS family permease
VASAALWSRQRSIAAYPILLALGALDAAAYSIIGPVAPAIAARTGAGPALIGVLVATFPAGIAAGFVIAGYATRTSRSVLVLPVGLALLAAGSVILSTGDTLAAFFVGRAVMGVGSGGVWLGATFATLARWPDQGYVCMSRLFAAYSVGGLLGPAIGGTGGIESPFAIYAGLAVMGIILVAVMGSAPTVHRIADRSTLRAPAFRIASAGILFAVLGLSLIEGVLPLRFSADLTQTQIGLLLAGTALVVAASSIAAARFAPDRALQTGVPLIVIGVTVAATVASVPGWVVGLAVGGTGIGLANTGAIGVLLHGVPRDRSVTAIVAWSQLGIVGYMMGPLIAGPAVEAVGYSVLGIILLAAAAPVALVVVAGTRRSKPAG